MKKRIGRPPKPERQKLVPVQVLLRPEKLARLKSIAADERRPLSQLLRNVLEMWADQLYTPKGVRLDLTNPHVRETLKRTLTANAASLLELTGIDLAQVLKKDSK